MQYTSKANEHNNMQKKITWPCEKAALLTNKLKDMQNDFTKFLNTVEKVTT